MRIYLVFLFLILLTFSCRQNEATKTERIDKDSLKREELKLTFINDSIQVKSITSDYRSFWTPSQNQTYLVDSIAIKAINDNPKNQHRFLKPGSYKDFYKQFVCFIDSKGDSIVFINAFCRVGNHVEFNKDKNPTMLRFDWQHYLYLVDDGGDCFWVIYINWTKRKCVRFTVNGFA